MTTRRKDDGEIRVQASVGGHRLTLDPPIRIVPLPLQLREVESTIPCGFQSDWGHTEYNGSELEITCGAGWGSRWATIVYKGKQYCFSVDDLGAAFLEAIGEKP